jgi:hypothetical protein
MLIFDSQLLHKVDLFRTVIQVAIQVILIFPVIFGVLA